jgi:hypothetical protein
MQDSDIDDSEAINIAKALERNKSITELDLGGKSCLTFLISKKIKLETQEQWL